jgi:hypothetical protein
MISLQAAVAAVVYLIVAGLIFWLLWFLVQYVAPPEPFRKVAGVVLVVFAVLAAIGILLSLVGGGPLFRWGP